MMKLTIAVLFLQVLLLVSADAASDAKHSRVKRAKPMSDVSLRVVTILAEPYTYVAPEDGSLYGFIPDLLNSLRHKLGFNLTLSLVHDARYGSKLKNGTWTGMIGKLIKNEMDSSQGYHMAAAPITVTAEREEVVDFLQPFSHIGLTVAIQKPSAKEGTPAPWHFSFNVFKPLSPACWATVLVVMVVVWLFFFVMNLFNPYEYGDRFKRNLANEDQAGLFSLSGSLWFTFTTLQWQGYDRAPRSIAAKMMGCFWMVFVTLTIVTYISSFLNYMFWASVTHKADPTVSPFRDLVDLVNQRDGYTYGCVKSGSTFNYLTNVGPAEEFKKMKAFWETAEGDKALVVGNYEGIQKMRDEKYAFIGETMFIRHAISKAENCDLMETGIRFGMRSYGFPVSNNMPHGEVLDRAVIDMIQSGAIEALEEKWWDEKRCHAVQRSEKDQSTFYLDKPQPVTMHMFWSPIVLIAVGFVLSCLAAGAEILWYKYRGKYDMSNRLGGQQLTNDEGEHI